jgi:hypothetical protein
VKAKTHGRSKRSTQDIRRRFQRQHTVAIVSTSSAQGTYDSRKHLERRTNGAAVVEARRSGRDCDGSRGAELLRLDHGAMKVFPEPAGGRLSLRSCLAGRADKDSVAQWMMLRGALQLRT